MPIEKGTIKVVWITADTKKIYSRMFESAEAADKFGKTKKDYVIFRLVWHKNHKDYCWTIMPYGKYRLYQKGINFYKKRGTRLLKRIFR